MTGSGEQFVHLPSGIDLCYETFGDPSDPPVLLAMGLGGPMGWWTTSFCEALAERGHFVIRYDNRDTGRSTKLRQHKVGRGAVIRAFLGRGGAPYGISDLADDAYGLLDALGLETAHLVGVSMGGMIVQTMAIAHPERVSSLVSIMSTTGRRTVGWQHPKLIPGLLASSGRTRDSYIERSLKTGALIASPAFPTTLEDSVARAEETYDRGWIASGVLRHMLAVLTQPDRTEQLGALTMPVTVIHGLSDPLVHRSGGRATAAAIKGSHHVEIAGMAHDIPTQLHAAIISEISDTVARAAKV
ncbi:alpha/beta hydrolase [Aeromicrobium sp. Root495]|uniref:alpha/beta fold hydrolase n=1 Tax=Aeromicrobium sp. Root495 TaxID=1736550 RepID=UPI0006F9C3C3|nr:alpha/beta hydrolase [Aeromicrobium sp. Root495]KQY58558.1 alpha/beta hydrolase [Aeromicrobium sp. Root495]